jgi:hypothetical protein
MKFKNPYVMTLLLGQEAGIIKAMMINTGSANIPLVAIAGFIGLGGFTTINSTLGDNVQYGVTDDAPATSGLASTAAALSSVSPRSAPTSLRSNATPLARHRP